MRNGKPGAENFRVKRLMKREGVCLFTWPGVCVCARVLFAYLLPWQYPLLDLKLRNSGASVVFASVSSEPNEVSHITRAQQAVREQAECRGPHGLGPGRPGPRQPTSRATGTPAEGRFGGQNFGQFSTKDTKHQSHACFISAHLL